MFKKTTFIPYFIIICLTVFICWQLVNKSFFTQTVIENNHISISKIQAIGKLELVKITIKDVLDYNIQRKFLPNSKVLLVVSGEIAGCIDLTKIDSTKIQITDSVVKIVLPKPEICYYKIDHQNSKIYNAQTYFMLDNQMELTQLVFKNAENYFKSDSLTQIVFRQTEKNAQLILKPLLQSITKKQVLLTFDKKETKN